MIILLTSAVIVHSYIFVAKCYEVNRNHVPSLEYALKLYPSDAIKMKLAEAYAETGVPDNLRKAETLLLEVLQNRPWDVHCLINVAKVTWVQRYRSGVREEALEYVKRALLVYPTFGHAQILHWDLKYCINSNKCYKLLPQSFYDKWGPCNKADLRYLCVPR